MYTTRPTRVTVERGGPLCAVVKVEGSIMDDAAHALLDFTARLHFYAGESGLRLDFTVENNHAVIMSEDGALVNVHDQGAVNSVYIGDLTLNLQLRDTGDLLNVFTEGGVEQNALAAPTPALPGFERHGRLGRVHRPGGLARRGSVGNTPPAIVLHACGV